MPNPDYALQPSFTLKGEYTYFDFESLNSGGYGITYLAKTTYFLHRIKQTATVALKEYFPRDLAVRNADGSVAPMLGKEKDFRECYDEFRREGEMLHGLEHSGIVPVNEVIETNGTIYYVMSYLGDMSLTRYVSEHGGQLGEEEARRVMHGLLDAVAYLHDQWLNHLDIKPDNVMMLESESGGRVPVLIDFGVSKHFHANGKQTSRLGGKGVTDGFSPLEQYAGISTFSPQADIYALGATYFFMLTGMVPLKANEINEEWIRKNLPKDLTKKSADAICNAMNRDVGQRTGKTIVFFGGTIVIKDSPIPPKPDIPYKKIAIGLAVLVMMGIIWIIPKGRETEAPIVIASDTIDSSLTSDSIPTTPSQHQPEENTGMQEEHSSGQEEFQIRYISMSEERDNLTELEINVEYPIKGNDALVYSIRKFINQTLSSNLKETLYDGDLSDGGSLVKYYYDLAAINPEMNIEIEFEVLYESDKFVSYFYTIDSYLQGDHHGSDVIGGASFVKENGSIVDWGMFKNDSEMQYQIKKGMESFYGSGNYNKDYTPFPKVGPVLLKDAVKFFYNRYELGGSYADGTPTFAIPYIDIKDQMKSAVVELIE